MKKDIKNIIKLELEQSCFDFSYKGTKIVAEVIYECSVKKSKKINLKKDIYPNVSKKFNINVDSLKVYIFYSISKMYDIVNKEKLSNLLGYKIINRPKPKEIIFAILEKIQNF